MKELVVHLGTRELNWDPGHSASNRTHLYQLKRSSVVMKPQFPFIALARCVQLSSGLLLIWKENLFSANWP